MTVKEANERIDNINVLLDKVEKLDKILYDYNLDLEYCEGCLVDAVLYLEEYKNLIKKKVQEAKLDI